MAIGDHHLSPLVYQVDLAHGPTSNKLVMDAVPLMTSGRSLFTRY